MSETDGPERVDVLRYESAEEPSHRSVEAGRGADVVAAHETEYRKRERIRRVTTAVVTVLAVGGGVGFDRPLVGVAGAAVVLGAFLLGGHDRDEVVPEVVATGVAPDRAAERYDLDVRARDGGK